MKKNKERKKAKKEKKNNTVLTKIIYEIMLKKEVFAVFAAFALIRRLASYIWDTAAKPNFKQKNRPAQRNVEKLDGQRFDLRKSQNHGSQSQRCESSVEKMITLAKKADLASTKKLIATLPQKMAVLKSIEVLRARYKDRTGGYTRILSLAIAPAIGANMVQIELV